MLLRLQFKQRWEVWRLMMTKLLLAAVEVILVAAGVAVIETEVQVAEIYQSIVAAAALKAS